MKEMEQEIEARERAQANPANPNATASNQPSKRQTQDQHTAAALLSGAFDPRCCYCQQAHLSGTCKVVTQVDARKQILRKSGRCFSCLRRGHLSRECTKSRCSKCGGKHHFTICLKASTAPPNTPDTPPSSETSVHPTTSTTGQSTSGLNPSVASFAVIPTTSVYIDTNTTVLLQTARTLVYNPAMPQPPQEVRMVLELVVRDCM